MGLKKEQLEEALVTSGENNSRLRDELRACEAECDTANARAVAAEYATEVARVWLRWFGDIVSSQAQQIDDLAARLGAAHEECDRTEETSHNLALLAESTYETLVCTRRACGLKPYPAEQPAPVPSPETGVVVHMQLDGQQIAEALAGWIR